MLLGVMECFCQPAWPVFSCDCHITSEWNSAGSNRREKIVTVACWCVIEYKKPSWMRNLPFSGSLAIANSSVNSTFWAFHTSWSFSHGFWKGEKHTRCFHLLSLPTLHPRQILLFHIWYWKFGSTCLPWHCFFPSRYLIVAPYSAHRWMHVLTISLVNKQSSGLWSV